MSEVKFREFGKKQYNYNSKLYKEYYLERSPKLHLCSYDSVDDDDKDSFISNNCEYVWKVSTIKTDSRYKYIFDRWLTSIIFSSFIFVCDLGLALFGFLLFKDSGK